MLIDSSCGEGSVALPSVAFSMATKGTGARIGAAMALSSIPWKVSHSLSVRFLLACGILRRCLMYQSKSALNKFCCKSY